MRKIISITAAAGLIALSGCKSGAEVKADKAWKAAQTITNDSEKLMKQKEAYIYYKQAIEKKKEKSSPELMSNFIEASVARIAYIYETEGSKAEAITLIREDIDKYVEKEGVSAKAKDDYATMIMKFAEDERKAGSLNNCMALVEKALRAAADKNAITATKTEIASDYASEQLNTAKTEYANGIKMKDTSSIVRAEYYAHATLNYDPQNAEALALLSQTRKDLVGTYSTYRIAVADKPDTVLFKKIDSTDILMAAPVVKTSGSGVTVEGTIYNYSYAAIRINPGVFFILDDAGTSYPAKTCTSEKEFLEQEIESKITLTFPKPAGKVKALVYQSADKEHYAAKYFY